MKIIKVCKNQNHYYVIFDKNIELTYEKIGMDYIGSYCNDEGDIMFSRELIYKSFKGAFAGREISLKMKNGENKTIKDYWYDNGNYKEHGEFMGIGIGTLEGLQNCFVFCSANINIYTFDKILDEYFRYDKIYEYDELREWLRFKHRWYDLIVGKQKTPFMVNKKGDIVERETKKQVYSGRLNVCKKVNDKYKNYHYLKLEYKSENRLIKLQGNYLKIMMDCLPYSRDEIIENCRLDGYKIN
jgi:hypothetical protein